MTSGKKLAKEYSERVEKWIAEREQQKDWAEYKRAGKINRAVLCAELDFSRSVFSQNPAVKTALVQAEERWFGLRDVTKAGHEAARERSEKAAATVSQAASKLRDEVALLKAENQLLRKRLAQYEVLAEVLAETGRTPRI